MLDRDEVAVPEIAGRAVVGLPEVVGRVQLDETRAPVAQQVHRHQAHFALQLLLISATMRARAAGVSDASGDRVTRPLVPAGTTGVASCADSARLRRESRRAWRRTTARDAASVRRAWMTPSVKKEIAVARMAELNTTRRAIPFRDSKFGNCIRRARAQPYSFALPTRMRGMALFAWKAKLLSCIEIGRERMSE